MHSLNVRPAPAQRAASGVKLPAGLRHPLCNHWACVRSLLPHREIDPSSLEIMEKLGEGEFGVVHRAKW